MADPYQLHPACSAWPELPQKELAALAEDISVNGLHEPLTLTPGGFLLDGRNRAIACEIAGVEPVTVTFEGDPILFSLSKNRFRRHMDNVDIARVTARLAKRPVGANQHSNEGSSQEPPSLAEAAIMPIMPIMPTAAAQKNGSLKLSIAAVRHVAKIKTSGRVFTGQAR